MMFQLLAINHFTYGTIVTFLFLLYYFFISKRIHEIEEMKTNRLKARQINEAVETETPFDNPKKRMKHKGVEGLETRFSFLHKLLPWLLGPFWFLLVVIPYISKIPAFALSSIVGIFSIFLGIAAKPFLENLFSGVVIAFSQPIRIGDTVVIDGKYGLIEEINLTHCILREWDWKRVVIPNSKLLQKEIDNHTIGDKYIWAHVAFYIAPDSDLDFIRMHALDIAAKAKHNNQSEPPSFWVMDLQKDAIQCWLAAWADNPGEAWELRNELRSQLVIAFRKHQINFQSIQVGLDHAHSTTQGIPLSTPLLHNKRL